MNAGDIKKSRVILQILGPFFFAGCLTVVFIAWWGMVVPVNAATPIYVRTDGSDSQCNGQFDLPYSGGSADCAFATITYGISQVDLGGDVNVSGGTYNESLVLNRAVTVTMSGNITLTGDLILQQGTLESTWQTLTLRGNYSRSASGSFIAGLGTLEMNGTSQQSIGGSAVSSFRHLVINNPQHVRLEFNESVFLTLTLQSGNLILGSNRLEFGPQGKVVGSFSASNMIVTSGTGTICKGWRENEIVPPGGLIFNFPVGDRTGTPEYSPARLTLTSGSFGSAPQVCLRVINQRKPENYFPYHLNRYWVMTSQNMTGVSSSIQFTYTQSDVVGVENELLALQYVGDEWEFGAPVNPTNNTFTKSASSFTSFTAGGNESLITINSFIATPLNGSIRLDWNTTYEENVLGFNVYRSTTSTPDQKLNGPMIPSVSGGSVSMGGSYTFTDTTASGGVLYNYWIQVVTSSSNEYFGPVEAIWFNALFLPRINRSF